MKGMIFMILLGCELPEKCFETDYKLSSHGTSFYKLKPYGDWYTTIATHIKEVWHDGEEYYSYELGYFVNGKWECIFGWSGEDRSVITF